MATSYVGKGTPLYLASTGSVREPVWTGMGVADPAIPTARSSIGIAVNNNLATDINVVFAAAPAGTAFSVMYDVDPTFATEYPLSAVVATADKAYTWTTNSRLSGFIRITNSGGQTINNAWLQGTAATFG